MSNIENLYKDEFGDDYIARRVDKLEKGSVVRSHRVADLAENLVAAINAEIKMDNEHNFEGMDKPVGERGALQNLMLSMEAGDEFDALYQMMLVIYELHDLAENVSDTKLQKELVRLTTILGRDYEVLRDNISRSEMMNIVSNYLIPDSIIKNNSFGGKTFKDGYEY